MDSYPLLYAGFVWSEDAMRLNRTTFAAKVGPLEAKYLQQKHSNATLQIHPLMVVCKQNSARSFAIQEAIVYIKRRDLEIMY